MTQRLSGLGPWVMFDIPQQPRPLSQPAVHAVSVRLQAPSQPTISPFTGPWQLEHLTRPRGILTAGQAQNVLHRLPT